MEESRIDYIPCNQKLFAVFKWSTDETKRPFEAGIQRIIGFRIETNDDFVITTPLVNAKIGFGDGFQDLTVEPMFIGTAGECFNYCCLSNLKINKDIIIEGKPIDIDIVSGKND